MTSNYKEDSYETGMDFFRQLSAGRDDGRLPVRGDDGPSKPAADSLRWFDPQQAGFPVVEGQAWPQELAGSYGRWPERLRSEIRDGVWKLSCQSAGLSVRFRSNASPIRVRYRLTRDQQRAMDHMPATGVSGLDLYALNRHGEEIHVKRRIDWSKADTIYYEFQPQPDDRFAAAGYEFSSICPCIMGSLS